MSRLIYPKPRDWNELEDMATDVFSREIQDSNLARFKRFGRQGQIQQGVDLTGFNGSKLVGLQCKNNPAGALSFSEVIGEAKKADKFKPKLDEYIVITSTDRDAVLQKKVLDFSKERKKKGKFPVSIFFWEDLCDLVLKYPDLTYKYFTKDFPVMALENPTIPDLNKRNRKTPVVRLAKPSANLIRLARQMGVLLSEDSPLVFSGNSGGEFKKFVTSAVSRLAQGKIARPNKYNLAIGFTTFENVSQQDVVDLDIDFSSFLSQRASLREFGLASKALNEIRGIISGPGFSRDLTIYLQSRLAYGFLLGWILRKSAHFNLNIVSGNQIWSSGNLPHVPAKIKESLPELGRTNSKDAVVILNFALRDITPAVKAHLKRSKLKFRTLLEYRLNDTRIQSAAHALSIAQEVSAKLKDIFDGWGVGAVHLFLAIPAPLAVLIGHHLNGIKPITLYYMDHDRKQYVAAGTITNNT